MWKVWWNALTKVLFCIYELNLILKTGERITLQDMKGDTFKGRRSMAIQAPSPMSENAHMIGSFLSIPVWERYRR